ncbi:hypothetical protein BHYA_0025g00230 [Botrytis hyacinthi]|uniref:Uncharacterized protein n=1 Tax=Botrytis hyacinthi TaxID=278943 RepID=A0A4Z1H7F2_9HELO|nr:hypothetical protein BHYA_0025g00230 [Botrytis hyacinthi]
MYNVFTQPNSLPPRQWPPGGPAERHFIDLPPPPPPAECLSFNSEIPRDQKAYLKAGKKEYPFTKHLARLSKHVLTYLYKEMGPIMV